MISLDTNVVSEPLRPTPATQVIDWLDQQPLETLYLLVMTVAELRAGVALLPLGRRRTQLHYTVETQLLPTFVGRVLPSTWRVQAPTPGSCRQRARLAAPSRRPMPASRRWP